MYEKAGYCGAIVFLGYLAIYDIKWKKIPAIGISVFGILSLIYLLLGRQYNLKHAALCMLPGMVLLALSLLTKEKIGYGDGAAVIILGFWTGALFCAGAVCVGIMMTGIYALYRVMQKNMEPIPFIPFLLAATEVMLVYV